MVRFSFYKSSQRERKFPGKEETWRPLRPWRYGASAAAAAAEDPDEEKISSSSRQKKPHKNGGGVGIMTGVPYTRDQIQEFLHQHDKMGDNSLSRAELKKAFEDMGSYFPAFRARQAVTVVGGADGTNGDGRINKEEMEDLVNYVTRLNLQNRVRP